MVRARNARTLSSLKMKRKVWSSRNADDRFSKWIRERDGKCLRCFTTENLTCSHYWRRGHPSTRYDVENCIALCGKCHSEWENTKNYEYKDFMIRLLGREKYDTLEDKSRRFSNRTDTIIKLMTWL